MKAYRRESKGELHSILTSVPVEGSRRIRAQSRSGPFFNRKSPVPAGI
jgi:hypothetical protein